MDYKKLIEDEAIDVFPIPGVTRNAFISGARFMLTTLQSRIEELERENEWVRVETKMPEPLGVSTDVTVVTKDNRQYIAVYDTTWQMWIHSNGLQSPIRHVTHWKPLLTPPNK